MPHLTDRQRELLDRWLPGAQVVRDHSWGLIDTIVLELRHDDDRFIAKAGAASNHHLTRELAAHRRWLRPWTALGRAPRLVHADEQAKLIVTGYLPGELVEGNAAERRLDTYRQAGELLAVLHAQYAVQDAGYEARANAKTLAWLDKPHRIAAGRVARVRQLVTSWPEPVTVLVPTHGDWQPRNWLVHDSVVSAIDFGRTELRPAPTDFARLAAQQFRTDPALEAAFLAGYGGDPREPVAWQRDQLREAVGTATWAYQVGNEAFERQGHRMLDDAIAAFDT